MRHVLLTAVILAAFAASASAGAVTDTEPNDSIAGAQNIDGNFTTEFQALINSGGANISTTVPHVTISGTGDGSVDFFSFTATAGTTGVFDIDGFSGGGSNDSFLRLRDTTGTSVASNDDGSDGVDPGGVDSFISHTFTQSGTYTIEVSDLFGPAISAGTTYTLHVSVPFGIAAVPEPGTWALFGLGMLGLGGLVRRRRRQRSTA